MRRTGWFVVECIIFVGAALAGAETPPSGAKTQSAFEATDGNNDSRIDRAEFHRRMADVFYFKDADRDGTLTLGELEGAEPAAFRAADRDGDGKLSFYEYIDSRFRDFEAVDENRDGILTPEEVQRR